MMLRSLMRVVGAVLLLALPISARAETLPPPTGTTILELSGNIANTTDGKVAKFDKAALEALGTTTVRTSTKWTEGPVTFEGPLMRDLLKKVGASGTEIVAVALNDYKVKIPIADFDKFNVILAHRRDGKAMPVRDKGPLWIMYPFDDNPSLKTDLYFARCAWQLKAIEVR
ncbi:molybdopterin-dependent oxidoreductase [Stella sp.]|uniref:molybdopterin-dependent oxidoreductase n=1 Tax=Stella sp. TaxID=2912054 RepID=UPI0035B3061D